MYKDKDGNIITSVSASADLFKNQKPGKVEVEFMPGTDEVRRITGEGAIVISFGGNKDMEEINIIIHGKISNIGMAKAVAQIIDTSTKGDPLAKAAILTLLLSSSL